MSKNRYGPYSLGIIVLLFTSIVTPVFAEVSSLNTNNESFFKGDQILFSGTVDEGTTGLVTIVIRDTNNEFVMLSQASINPDNTFEDSIKITDKFSQHGVYNATGFILNMTQGVTSEFGISLNGVPIVINQEITEESSKEDNTTEIVEEPIEIAEEESTVSAVADFVDSDKDPQYYIDRYYNEPTYKSWFDRNYPGLTIEEAVGHVEEPIEIAEEESTVSAVADFVDSDKDPQYYIDRYYNEPTYKSWFDRNYPGLTIEEAVGQTDNLDEVKSTVQEIIDKEILPEAQASSIVEPVQQSSEDSDTAKIVLAITTLAILFGAVYGVKRKVDHNTRQISINRETIRRKLIHPIMGDDNPKEILQARLAKGEITLEEYEKLRAKLY